MDFIQGLQQIIPAARMKSSLIDRVSYASDAGFYELTPKVIVQPITEAEIAGLFGYAHQTGVPLVFRTGGTSLSGQAITDGILVDLSKDWSQIQILDNGERVRVQPGIIGAIVNAHLQSYGRKIGPDPSSISAAMMGGILSNNASGMCCGVVHNSYHTTTAIRFMLTDGRVYHTAKPEDYDRFLTEQKTLADTLQNIRQELLCQPELYEKIRQKYQTKNTVGYSLNACIDFEHPLDIFAHLLIGAEGTLAFIAEAELQTLPEYPHKSTTLLYFPDIYAACKAIRPLINAGAAMVELMDFASLKAVENMDGMDPFVKTVPEGAAALLIEFQAPDLVSLEAQVNGFLAGIATYALLNPPEFTSNPAKRAFYWKVRKGLFPAVGAVRASGTTVILEDVAFPVDVLGDAILDLQKLFKKYQYDNAIIFGHAKDGNIHFVVTQAFRTPAEIQRYQAFMDEVVHLVVHTYQGALKAEHGTGRNMAPFVETEWGTLAYSYMRRIKEAADPKAILNPGVIINEHKDAHIQNLKALPTVESEVDRCIECGYCEPVCPSRQLTMSPRRRIVARRKLASFKEQGDQNSYDSLLEAYQYDGLDTCAVDGLCAGACPVYINTGDLVKRLRREQHGAFSNRIALQVADHFKWVAGTAGVLLKAGAAVNGLLGAQTMTKLTKGMKRLVPSMPLWSPEMGMPAKVPQSTDAIHAASVLYFPTCISRLMGKAPGKDKSVMDAFMSVSDKAGLKVRIISNPADACCGQIFSSKGFSPAFQKQANSIIAKLFDESNKGSIPIVTDISSCTYTLQTMRGALTSVNQTKYDQLRILDSVDYLYDMVLPRNYAVQAKGKVVLHPVCSLSKMGNASKLERIAAQFAQEVTVPIEAGCCGMAGDRGFLFPELTQSATRKESEEVKAQNFDGYYSSAKPCEMAMSASVQKQYESILFLVDEAMVAVQ
jgi:D-lactate dehydrogenase